MRIASAQTGFTLIELLVTLTIAAILLAVGVPMFNSSIASARASDGANSLLAALELARSEAVRRGVNVSVCRVTAVPATACSNTAAGSFVAGDWASGWMVFADTVAGGTVGAFDAGDEIVQYQQQFAPGGATRVEIIDTGAAIGIVTYRPDGLRANGGGAASTFRVAYPQAAQGTGVSCRQVTVNVTGQAQVTRVNC